MKNDLYNDTLPIMRDTPFASLMNRRIYNVLLIATPYDAFMLEDDGRVDEEILMNTHRSTCAIHPALRVSPHKRRHWQSCPTAIWVGHHYAQPCRQRVL